MFRRQHHLDRIPRGVLPLQRQPISSQVEEFSPEVAPETLTTTREDQPQSVVRREKLFPDQKDVKMLGDGRLYVPQGLNPVSFLNRGFTVVTDGVREGELVNVCSMSMTDDRVGGGRGSGPRTKSNMSLLTAPRRAAGGQERVRERTRRLVQGQANVDELDYEEMEERLLP